MLTYMLDTNICIHVMKNYPQALREKFNSLAEQLCISSITLGELHYGAEKSARRIDNLSAIEHFVARLDVLPFEAKAAAHYGQVRAELERAGTPCGPHDMQIGGHARSEGLIVITNNIREFNRMPGIRVENWVRALLPLDRARRLARHVIDHAFEMKFLEEFGDSAFK
jgi:tRNA(fMet)-specific endonuclease VapC